MRLPGTPAGTLRAKRMSPGSPGRTHQLGAGAGTPSTALARGDVFLFPTPPFLSAPLPSPALPPPLPVSVRSPQSPGSWGIGVSSRSGLAPGLTFQGASGCGPAAPLGTQNSEDQRPQQGRWCRWASGVRVASCPGLTGRLCGPGQWLRPTEPRFPHAQGGAVTALSPRTGEKRERAAACEEPRGWAGLAVAPLVSDIAAPDRRGFSIVVASPPSLSFPRVREETPRLACAGPGPRAPAVSPESAASSRAAPGPRRGPPVPRPAHL